MISDVARRAFTWIESVAVPVDGGLGWTEAGERFDDLYAGTAGVLLGCAEATAAGLSTVDGSLERVAAGARGRLLHLVGHESDRPGPEESGEIDDSLFCGWGGVAVVLRCWASVTGDQPALDAAGTLTARIAERLARRPKRLRPYHDIISGDAGLLLALLGAADHAAAGRLADDLADDLVDAAEERPEGPHWRMLVGDGTIMPGFSHGTAGVAYALATAGVRLRRDDLLAVAVRAADGLLALGDRPGGWALPLHVPPKANRPAVNFGWCHGPTGTVRLFALLDSVDEQPRFGHAVEMCLQALRDSRIPARLHPGYWDNLGRCCGTAGVGHLLLDRYHTTGDPALLDWAGVLAADVLARTVDTPHGSTWSHTEHTATPPLLPPEPGFMQGAAGIAGWLARLAAPGTPSVLPWL